MELKPIAYIKTDFPEKFGIPRQSGRVPGLKGRIILEKEFRDPDFIRGIEEFSHLWLIWGFSENEREKISPTVRPPRLGGNVRVGVFATRSPFRPNPIGLSCVKLEKIEKDEKLGTILTVGGIDMKDGTPVYDIKPYIPHADMVENAVGGFSDREKDHELAVQIPEAAKKDIDPEILSVIKEILAEDPRPAYQDDAARIYGFSFAEYEISFRVENETATVTEISKAKK